MCQYTLSVVVVFGLIWLVAWLWLRNDSYDFNPKGEARAFEPHLTRYQDFGKLLVLIGTASLAFFINFLVNLSTVTPRSEYSRALERHIAAPIWFLCTSVALTLLFMLAQTFLYESYSHGAKYTAPIYALVLAIGYSATFWFVCSYAYLVFMLIPIVQKSATP
jgi:hypothetical protein